MAVTTAPNVFCTASPTFRAMSVPPSSSACASVISVDNDKRDVSSQSFPEWKTQGQSSRLLASSPWISAVSYSDCKGPGLWLSPKLHDICSLHLHPSFKKVNVLLKSENFGEHTLEPSTKRDQSKLSLINTGGFPNFDFSVSVRSISHVVQPGHDPSKGSATKTSHEMMG